MSSLPHVPQKTQTTKKMRVKKRDGGIHKCLLASNFSNLIICPGIALSTFSGGKWSLPGRNDNRNTNDDYEMTKIITIFIRWEYWSRACDQRGVNWCWLFGWEIAAFLNSLFVTFLFSTSFHGKDDGGSCARVPILVNGIALPPCTVYIGHHRLPHNQKVTGQKTCKYRNNKYIITMNCQITKRSQAKTM